MIFISGKTIKGSPVISGVWGLIGTYGIPMSLILDYFRDHNFIIDWKDFVENALKDGINVSSLLNKIEESYRDTRIRTSAEIIHE